MDNSELVSSFLRREGLYPEGKPGEGGLRLSLAHRQVCLQGAPADLIGLADLLVSLALSGEAHGQHWHIDELTLMDEESEIPELALLRE
ncbi:MAG: hypothetical protein HFE45_02620 [Oscillospiraceae bacterium]|jgi:hypothetical protein|nr:hypothetical protein [Oscillospiraceae bacterium]